MRRLTEELFRDDKSCGGSSSKHECMPDGSLDQLVLTVAGCVAAESPVEHCHRTQDLRQRIVCARKSESFKRTVRLTLISMCKASDEAARTIGILCLLSGQRKTCEYHRPPTVTQLARI